MTDRYLRGWAKRIDNSKGLPGFDERVFAALDRIGKHERKRCAVYWKRHVDSEKIAHAQTATQFMALQAATHRFLAAWKDDSADDGWPWHEHMARMIDELGELLEHQRKERGAR
ncbi:MAG TPA: hypothetical protein DCQ64_01180 [Candidatus Rokubacteria bacterium]|nr:hypothetical protein [Candidatus Rokubacteria bacterium]